MPENISRTSVIFAFIIALAVVAVVVLIIGLSVSVSSGYRVGPGSGFGAGLTAVNVGVMLGVASGSLALHLWHMKDNARQRQERTRDAARIQEQLAGIRAGLDVVVLQMTEEHEARADRVGRQRRHES